MHQYLVTEIGAKIVEKENLTLTHFPPYVFSFGGTMSNHVIQ